jgi:hypothetical protein
LVLGDLKNVIRLMLGALKNLRSQVARAAGQVTVLPNTIFPN